MKIFKISLILFLFVSCQKDVKKQYRKDFNDEEKSIISESKDLIKQAYFTTLITMDGQGQPRARVLETFAPDSNFVVWMGTNPRSRKVKQIQNNATATLHYFDKAMMSYVSLMGKAYMVNDDSIKAQKWKEGWERFYPDRKKDYMLIKFVPETLEFIGIVKGYTGDKTTWAPHRVVLRK
jgi:general stress protein 26